MKIGILNTFVEDEGLHPGAIVYEFGGFTYGVISGKGIAVINESAQEDGFFEVPSDSVFWVEADTPLGELVLSAQNILEVTDSKFNEIFRAYELANFAKNEKAMVEQPILVGLVKLHRPVCYKELN